MAEKIPADYLVVGAGAMGLAFVDTLLTDTKKHIVMVDRYPRPGGHWITAYPFVRLHQPAVFYGVNSRPLGSQKLDEVGWNKGLPELASRDEILSYFDLLMREDFLPSGRVKYFPKHEYLGNGQFRSMLTDKTYEVGKETTIVDATYSRTKVPSMGPPAYEVAQGVELVTPNDLPAIKRGYANYTVVGAGKTALDSLLWLIENSIDQANITWIMPRDPICFRRDAFQLSGPGFESKSPQVIAASQGAAMSANSVEEMQRGQMKAGMLDMIDASKEPTMWHCATVSELELDALRKIENVVRKGRVTRITPEEVTLTKGSYKPIPDTLYVDCSASAVAKMPAIPVFQPKLITLQPVRQCQQTFSAAVIAHLEATYEDLETKNLLSGPVPMPNVPADELVTQVQTYTNALNWAKYPKTQAFVSSSRLDLLGAFMPPLPEDPEQRAEAGKKMLEHVGEMAKKYRDLIEALPEPEAARLRNELEPPKMIVTVGQ